MESEKVTPSQIGHLATTPGPCTHDYVRHGTTNLFAALNVGTGEVYGQCLPTRNGTAFLAFVKTAVKPHTGSEVHLALD